MYHNTDDLRIRSQQPLLSPAIVLHDIRPSEKATEVVSSGRRDASRIISGQDDRLLVIVGPCSVHDVRAAKEYAGLLRREAERLSKDLLVVMRVYFEKPRTTVGWKGLINDPRVDGSFRINDGLRLARQLLGHRRVRPALRHRIPRPHHAAVRGRPRVLRRHRRPHHREPDPS